MAWLNLCGQFLPFIAAFFTRKPWLRFLLGLAFVAEELGLAFIMQLPDWQWLPLLAFFIDWDALIGWFRKTKKPLAEVKLRPYTAGWANKAAVASSF